jgi:hypothetical protein
MKGLFNDIWNEGRKYLLSILTGILLFPVLKITKFEGIIYKAGVLDRGSKSIKFPIFCTKDVITDIVFNVTIIDTNKYIHDYPRMVLERIPGDENWSRSNCKQFGNTTSQDKSILITKIVKDEYLLNVPVYIKDSGNSFKQAADITIKFFSKNKDSTKEVFADTKKYRWYDWIWFNSILASLIVLGILIIIQIIYYKYHKKKIS